MRSRPTFVHELVQRVEFASSKSESTFIIPTADLDRLLELYDDAVDEISDLNEEITRLVKEIGS